MYIILLRYCFGFTKKIDICLKACLNQLIDSSCSG